jgi:hypothetical protein
VVFDVVGLASCRIQKKYGSAHRGRNVPVFAVGRSFAPIHDWGLARRPVERNPVAKPIEPASGGVIERKILKLNEISRRSERRLVLWISGKTIAGLTRSLRRATGLAPGSANGSRGPVCNVNLISCNLLILLRKLNV